MRRGVHKITPADSVYLFLVLIYYTWIMDGQTFLRGGVKRVILFVDVMHMSLNHQNTHHLLAHAGGIADWECLIKFHYASQLLPHFSFNLSSSF